MSFRRRNYPEVLETMLTGLAGGVAAEAHPYPPPGDGTRMALEAPPAHQLVSVYGAVNGLSHRFRSGTDVDLSADASTLIWQAGGTRPDKGTLVEVNYLRRDASTQLTDFEVGGVARTLAEAMARETARVHAELDGVYKAGFLESATGRALDNVVALLGVTRVPAGRATATLRFTRDTGSSGAITVPAGTRIIDAEVKVEYETVQAVTLSPAQSRVTVDARDVEPGNSPVGVDVLTVLPVPIAGITAVTNPAPASRAEAAETDVQLRTRARAFLQGSEAGTLGALKAALARQGLKGEITEPASRPGVVVVTPVSSALGPERHAQLLRALNDARPAGVRIELGGVSVPLSVDVALQISTGSGLTDTERRAAHAAVRTAVNAYFENLPVKENASINRIVGDVLAVPGIEDVTLSSALLALPGGSEERLDATAGIINLAGHATALAELSLADPGLPTQVDLAIRFAAADTAPDSNAVTASVEAAFAHLGTAAAGSGAADTRTLSFGKLLRVLPGPVGQGETLAAYDAAATKPALPTDAGTYAVTAFIAQANGLTRMLAATADSYVLGTGERLTLASVSVEVEA